MLLAVLLGPIARIFLTSIKPLSGVYTTTLFFEPTLDNFRAIFERPFHVGDRLLNSLAISDFTVPIGVPAALAAAYSFSRFAMRFKRRCSSAYSQPGSCRPSLWCCRFS